MSSSRGLRKLQFRNGATSEKRHTSFNIFTKHGESKCDVKSPRPMTLEEAQDYFGALSIGAND